MAYQFHYTPTGTGVISGKEVLEQTEDAINDLSGQISGDVQTAIDTANNALNTANTASADAQNAVNTANTAYTAATNAQNTANAAQTTATNAQNAATAAQNDVDALENVVTGIDGRLTTTEGNVTNLTTRMGTAEGNIGNLQTAVSTAQATANSAQQTATTARQQSYVVRYASVAVSDNSTVPYTDLNNVDNVKANDLLLDTNGKIYQISSVDTSNETVSVTTPLTQLAVDSSVVHKSGDETVGGQKTLVNLLPLKGENLGTEASNNARSLLSFLANRDTQDQSGIFLTKFRQNKPQGGMSGNDVAYLSFDCLENSVRTNNGLRINFLNFVDDIPQRFVLWSGITERLLGATSAPWSDVYTNQINSLNPGSLSLPDLNNGIDISGYVTDLTGGTNNFTPTVDGYISLCAISNATNGAFIKQGDFGASGRDITISGTRYAYACLPVVKNIQVDIAVVSQSLGFAKFYPCQGNV